MSDHPMSPADERWVVALNELEQNLMRFADVSLAVYGGVDDAPPIPEPYLLPTDLGPVPPWLHPRVTDLVHRSAIVESELLQVRDVISAQLTARPQTRNHAYHDDHDAKYLDQVG